MMAYRLVLVVEDDARLALDEHIGDFLGNHPTQVRRFVVERVVDTFMEQRCLHTMRVSELELDRITQLALTCRSFVDAREFTIDPPLSWLVERTEEELIACSDIGPARLEKIKAALEVHGLNLKQN